MSVFFCFFWVCAVINVCVVCDLSCGVVLFWVLLIVCIMFVCAVFNVCVLFKIYCALLYVCLNSCLI